ncbi:MAG: hypothetical protein LBC68_15225 [Prevotellaceae bacterium]|jgi:hypothetical protein|nr:hypothetical protein [Prevotellaceae bacterium]
MTDDRNNFSELPAFGAGSACVALNAKLRFAANRETCFYLRHSGTLRRTEEK